LLPNYQLPTQITTEIGSSCHSTGRPAKGGANPPPTASKFSFYENLLPNYKLLTQITKLSLPENSREARIFSN